MILKLDMKNFFNVGTLLVTIILNIEFLNTNVTHYTIIRICHILFIFIKFNNINNLLGGML